VSDRRYSLVNHSHYPITDNERDSGILVVNLAYPSGNVLRYGADPTGSSSSSAAVQAAVDSLDANLGGLVTIPEGRYIVGDILVDGDDFANGGVWFELSPRTVIDVPSSADHCIKFQGASSASPINNVGVTGGRIVGTEDGADYGIHLEDVTNWHVRDTSIVQFFSSPRGTRAGIYCEYAIYGVITRPQIDTCDFGINVENDSTNTYRQTTVQIVGGSVRTCYRALRVDDGVNINAFGTAFENSSIGVYYDYTRTTGTNSASCSLMACYFERNGRHIKITEHGTAISRGIVIQNCYLESVSTTYVSTDSFEDSNSGDYKLDIDGSNHVIVGNHWSSAASVADILIVSGALNNYIGRQGVQASSVALSDSGTGTLNDMTPLTSENDATVNAKFRFSDNIRLENDIALQALNNAGSSWRNLLKITTGDNILVGNSGDSTIVYSSDQPRWFDGANTERICTSDGDTGGSSSAGAGNQYVEININGTVYKVLHDGTV